MNVTEEAGKNSDAARIKWKLSAIEWKKKFLQNLLYAVVWYKTLIEKYFCSVQKLPNFEQKNEQRNKQTNKQPNKLTEDFDTSIVIERRQ